MLGDPPNYSHLWKIIIGDERKVQRGDLYQIIHLGSSGGPRKGKCCWQTTCQSGKSPWRSLVW